MIPAQHRDFAAKLLADHGVPELPEDETRHRELLGWTAATAAPQVEVALAHDKVKLIANALGTPPADVIEEIHDVGPPGGRAVRHAPSRRSPTRRPGVDIIIAQGTEGGGHTGEIGSIVLWPQVIDAVAPTPGARRRRHRHRAPDGGGAGDGRPGRLDRLDLADGRGGRQRRRRRWRSYLDASSRDTVRSRSWTGKPCRMLRNDWTEAWEREDTPDPLGMPLQFMVSGEAVARGHRYPEAARDVMFNPVGQIVGSMDKTRKVKDVIYDLVQECIDTQERMTELFEG